MSGENADTSTDILEGRYRSKRAQNTLNVELGLTTKTSISNGGSQGAFGSVTGSVGGSPIIIEQTGGGGGSGGSGGTLCPEIGQWVKVMGDDGVVAIRVLSLEVGAYLWNPITRGFEAVIFAEERESELMEVTDGWIHAVGSPSHPLIRNDNDSTGLALEKYIVGQPALANIGLIHRSTAITAISKIGKGRVKEIKTEGPTHIYCAGSDPDDMFVFHNAKPTGGNEV